MPIPQPALLVQQIKTVFICTHCNKETTSQIDHIDLNVNDRSIGTWHCSNCGMGNSLSIVDNVLMVTPSVEREVKTISLLRSFEPLLSGDYIYLFIKTSSWSDKNGNIGSIEEINSKKEYYINQSTCPVNWLKCDIVHDNDFDPHGVFVHVRTIIAPEAPHALYSNSGDTEADPDETYDSCIGFNENVLRELFPEATISSKTTIDKSQLH